MGLMAKSSGEDYVLPPEDIHNAVCIGVWELGRLQTQYGIKHQVYLRFEIDAQQEDGKRYQVGRKYSPSLHEKATFRQLLESWSGAKLTKEAAKAGYDVLRLLGKPCQLQVIYADYDGKTYANVGSVTKLGKGMAALKPSVPLSSFTFEDNGKTIPESVPEWIKKIIMSTVNWQSIKEGASQDNEPEYAPDEDPNSIPF